MVSDGLAPSAEALFQHLRTVRTSLAKSEGIAAYMVFADRTLIEMAERRPNDAAAMRAIYGVGERKFERYGPVFLKEIRWFEAEARV